MSNLDLIKTLTPNVCIAHNVDPNDIEACLSLARKLNNVTTSNSSDMTTFHINGRCIKIPTSICKLYEQKFHYALPEDHMLNYVYGALGTEPEETAKTMTDEELSAYTILCVCDDIYDYL